MVVPKKRLGRDVLEYLGDKKRGGNHQSSLVCSLLRQLLLELCCLQVQMAIAEAALTSCKEELIDNLPAPVSCMPVFVYERIVSSLVRKPDIPEPNQSRRGVNLQFQEKYMGFD